MSELALRLLYRFGMKLPLGCLVLVTLGLAACATVPRDTPQTIPRPWRVAQTEHFTVYADRDDGALVATADDLERTYRAVVTLPGLAIAAPPTEAIDVVTLSDESVQLPVTSHPPIVVRRPIYGSLREAIVFQVVQRIVHEGLPRAPWWVQQGLAEYLSTIEVDDDSMRVGARPVRFHAPDPLGDPEDIVTAPDASAIPRADRKAWALVHLLQEDAKHVGVFRRYLEKLGAGVAPARAWEETRAQLPWTAFRRDFGDYLRREPHATWRVAQRPPLRTAQRSAQ